VRTRLGILILFATLLTGAATSTTAHAADGRSGCSPKVQSLKLPKSFHAGESVTGRVKLSCAPRHAVRVTLADDQAHVKEPRSLRVPAGHLKVSFTLEATAARGDSYVAKVTARRGGSRTTRPVTVTPGLSLVEIAQSSLPNDVDLEILFTGQLPPGGGVVKLASDNKAVTVPPKTTFQVGAVGGDVPGIVVHEVKKRTKVTLSVTYGRRTLTATKTLVPPADPDHPAFEVRRDGGTGPVYRGTRNVQFDVFLKAPAPADGLQVSYSILGDNPDVTLESDSGYIVEGHDSDAVGLDFAAVTTPDTVTLEATIGQTVVDLPIIVEPAVTEIDLPDTVVGGQDFIGTVQLAGAASVDTVVDLSPSWSIVHVPLSVTIPAGQTSATFTGHTTTVDDDSPVFVTGTYGDQDDLSVGSNQMTVTP
jgi:hypothetical protein